MMFASFLAALVTNAGRSACFVGVLHAAVYIRFAMP